MNCQKFRAHIYDYHYDVLENKENFEQHLQSCYECKEKFDQQQEGLHLLQAWQPQGEAPTIEKMATPEHSYWKVAAIFFFITSTVVSILFVQQSHKLSHSVLAEGNYRKSMEYNSKQLKEFQAKYQEMSKRYEKVIVEQQQKHMQKVAEEKISREQNQSPLNSRMEEIKNLEARIKKLQEKKSLFHPDSAIRKRYEQEISDALSAIKQKQKTIKSLQQELENAIVAKTSSEEEQLVLQTELNNLRGELQEKEALIQRQQRELLEAKKIISSAEKTGVRLELLYATERPLDGFVTAVSKKLPLVMLSVGSDDRVLNGYEFTVFREQKYIGAVVVEDVYKDACAARIITEKTPIKIERGDSVTTRFNGNKQNTKKADVTKEKKP